MAAVQFEIRVAGAVPAGVLEELGNVRVLTQSVKTVLRGAVPDQAALMAVINRLQGLGIELCEPATTLSDDRSVEGPPKGGAVPEYEIEVVGPIGPVVASALPGFTAVEVPMVTVLGGTVACADELRSVVDVLGAHGFAPVELRIDPQDGADDSILAGHRCTVTGATGA